MHRIQKWGETYLQLSRAGEDHTLEPQELETLAVAAYLTGSDTESYGILEQAQQGYLDCAKPERAARCAFWLGLMFMNAGERGRSSGWMAKGERIISNELRKPCPEKDLFLIPAALEALYTGQPARAQKLFEQAAIAGDQFEDADLIALGRLGQGQALIQQGSVASGIKLIDETLITVEGDEIFPVVKGIVYCAAIETCRKVWDLRRAHEWTAALTRWCESEPDIIPFRGQCLVRRAEIIQLYGKWSKALEETSNACKLLIRRSGEPAAGEAYYRKAEVQRLLGDLDGAEASYRESAKWGRKPQPGLALLRLAQGQYNTAETSIDNTLRETKDVRKRAELLPAMVDIMIVARRIEDSLAAANELHGIANVFNAPYLYAMSAHCAGAAFLARGNIQSALDQTQKALSLWHTLDLPYESARTREVKGLIYQKLKDQDNSDAELAAAKWTFKQLKATPDLHRVEQLLKRKRNHANHGLTLRELQVLRRVASGQTNKSVADELFISERTVDRHVSNIFNKIGVSSRVEATTFAIKNKMLDI